VDVREGAVVGTKVGDDDGLCEGGMDGSKLRYEVGIRVGLPLGAFVGG